MNSPYCQLIWAVQKMGIRNNFIGGMDSSRPNSSQMNSVPVHFSPFYKKFELTHQFCGYNSQVYTPWELGFDQIGCDFA